MRGQKEDLLLVRLGEKVFTRLTEEQKDVIYSKAGRDQKMFLNYIATFINDSVLEEDIDSCLSQIFASNRLVNVKESSSAESLANDVVDSASIKDEEHKKVDNGELKTKKKKKGKKKKGGQNAAIITDNDDLKSSAEEERRLKIEFVTVLENCFNPVITDIRINEDFQNIPIIARIELLGMVWNDFVAQLESDPKASIIVKSDLMARIKILYSLLSIDRKCFEEFDYTEIQSIEDKIKSYIVEIVCYGIDCNFITERNIEARVSELRKDCSLSVDDFSRISKKLLEAKKITLANFKKWQDAISRKGSSLRLHEFISGFVKAAVMHGYITTQSLDNWAKFLVSKEYKEEEFVRQIALGLRKKSNFELYQYIEWNQKLVKLFNLNKSLFPKMILDSQNNRLVKQSKTDLTIENVLVILIDIINPQVRTLSAGDNSKYRLLNKDVILEYLKNNQVTFSSLEIASIMLKELLQDVQDVYDNFKDVYLIKSSSDDIVGDKIELLISKIAGLDYSAQQGFLKYIVSRYMINQQPNFADVYFITKILHGLINANKDSGNDKIILYAGNLYIIVYYGIDKKVLNLDNTGNWLDLVKTLDVLGLDCYARINQDILHAIVDNYTDYKAEDLWLWQNLLVQKFYSILHVREEMKNYSAMSRIEESDESEQRKKFFVRCFQNHKTFLLTAVNMICLKERKGQLPPNFIDYIRVIIREPNLALDFLPMRLEQFHKYFSQAKINEQQRSANRTEEAKDKIKQYVFGEKNFNIPKDFKYIEAFDINILSELITIKLVEINQKCTDIEAKSQEFFTLMQRQRFLFQIFILYKIDTKMAELDVNRLMMNAVFAQGIVECDRDSITSFCRKAKLSMDEFIGNFFKYSFFEDGFELKKVLNWLELFKETVPPEYCISQISEVGPNDSQEFLQGYYLYNSCLKAMYEVTDAVGEESSYSKVDADNLDGFKAVVVGHYLLPGQASYLKTLSIETQERLVAKIWDDEDLAKENISDKFADILCEQLMANPEKLGSDLFG